MHSTLIDLKFEFLTSDRYTFIPSLSLLNSQLYCAKIGEATSSHNNVEKENLIVNFIIILGNL
jgi:hypothetical protein